ncbi:MAG: hypothetical protein ACM3UZ_11480 [Acidobacteriota bacterium]
METHYLTYFGISLVIFLVLWLFALTYLDRAGFGRKMIWLVSILDMVMLVSFPFLMHIVSWYGVVLVDVLLVVVAGVYYYVKRDVFDDRPASIKEQPSNDEQIDHEQWLLGRVFKPKTINTPKAEASAEEKKQDLDEKVVVSHGEVTIEVAPEVEPEVEFEESPVEAIVQAEPEPEPEPAAEAVVQAEPEPEPEPAVEAVVQAEPEPEPEPAVEAVVQAEPEPEPEPAVETAVDEKTVDETSQVEDAPEEPKKPKVKLVAAAPSHAALKEILKTEHIPSRMHINIEEEQTKKPESIVKEEPAAQPVVEEPAKAADPKPEPEVVEESVVVEETVSVKEAAIETADDTAPVVEPEPEAIVEETLIEDQKSKDVEELIEEPSVELVESELVEEIIEEVAEPEPEVVEEPAVVEAPMAEIIEVVANEPVTEVLEEAVEPVEEPTAAVEEIIEEIAEPEPDIVEEASVVEESTADVTEEVIEAVVELEPEVAEPAPVVVEEPAVDIVEEIVEAVVEPELEVVEPTPAVIEVPESEVIGELEEETVEGSEDSMDQEEEDTTPVFKYIEDGFAAKDRGELDSAAASFMKALSHELDPQLVLLIGIEVSHLFMQIGSYDEAISVLEKIRTQVVPDKMSSVEMELNYLKALKDLLDRAGLTGIPAAKIPRFYRIRAEEIARSK